jgi:hypothetical protein
MLSTLPNEILLEIFSHLNLNEMYKMGHVCRPWQLQRDLAVARGIQLAGQKILICTSPKLNLKNTMNLTFASYENGWIDFELSDKEEGRLPIDVQGLRMVFNGWTPQESAPATLPPLQQAHYAFHHTYNAMHQRLYLLPSSSQQEQRSWVGDKVGGALILVENHHVVLARVTIPWLLSRPTLTPPRMDDGDLTHCSSPALERWQRLQQILMARSIDPSVAWKYHLSKLFLLGKSPLTLDEVVMKIESSENEWQVEKPKLIKALATISV